MDENILHPLGAKLEDLNAILIKQELVLEEILTIVTTTNQDQTDAIKKIATILDKHFGSMVEALTGKDHLPMPVAILVVRILGFALIGLIFALIFVLTGQKWNLLPLLHGN